MQFVADLVGHLAWPLALVILATVFRRPLAALIGDLSEGEAGPGGLKFKRAWRHTAQAVARSEAALPTEPELSGDAPSAEPDETSLDSGPVPSPIERWHAATQPEFAIQGAHRAVANRLHELLGEGPIGSTRLSNDIAELANRAHRGGLIPDAVLDTIEGLSVLYELAEAAPSRVTPAQAQEFQVLSKGLLYTLSDRQLKRANKVEQAQSASAG